MFLVDLYSIIWDHNPGMPGHPPGLPAILPDLMFPDIPIGRRRQLLSSRMMDRHPRCHLVEDAPKEAKGVNLIVVKARWEA
jgi:hypothetical protein